ncbi:NUDIX domain-containing protein [Bacillus oleivorans]|uniref:NUDIX domain-containing protein n=1 Tax=Bacillus oleivorans TaxID=1448271 RepID=A0A285CME2_9BACI|nr:NUDIX domain-containing protein [Bacillus oleivorans]SNX68691.1 NUDIX domain-containing protein [Bacillus oleivorans]
MDKPIHHLARGIFIKNNHILLAQAIGHKNTFLPGGHIELGESAKDALIREIEEELGIRCEVKKFLGLVEHKWEMNGIVHFEINQVFLVDSSELTLDLNPVSKESHIEFFWSDIHSEKFKVLQPYPIRNLLKKYLKGDRTIWWESTLNDKSDDENISEY